MILDSAVGVQSGCASEALPRETRVPHRESGPAVCGPMRTTIRVFMGTRSPSREAAVGDGQLGEEL